MEEIGWGLEGSRYVVLPLRSFLSGREAERHIHITRHVIVTEPMTVPGVKEGGHQHQDPREGNDFLKGPHVQRAAEQVGLEISSPELCPRFPAPSKSPGVVEERGGWAREG